MSPVSAPAGTRPGANTVLDARLSFGRFTQFLPDSSGAGGLTAADLGMAIPRPPTITTDNPPRFNLESFSSIIGNTYTWNSQSQWDAQPNVIQTHGRHVLHFGAEFVHAAIGGAGPGRANGEFTFGRAWSGQYTRGSLNARDGSSIADLLLGTPQSGFIDYNDSSYRSWPYWALYIQDYWKVAPKLTVNLGLRYDVQVPFVERFNRLNAGFDFSHSRLLGNLSVNHTDSAYWQDVLDVRFAGSTKPYTVVNGAIGVRWAKNKLVTSLKVTNLGNQQVQEHIFGDIVRRQVVGEARVGF